MPKSLTNRMGFAVSSCHACGKTGTKLQRCGRCRSVSFCNFECHTTAVKVLGHTGSNCCPADGGQKNAAQLSTPVDTADLVRKYLDLLHDVDGLRMTNSRDSHLAAVDKLKAAAAFSDEIGGAQGAFRRSDSDELLANSLVCLGDMGSAAHAACSSLQAARASGSKLMLVSALATCGEVAKLAPGEMAIVESESRRREKSTGSPPPCGRLDLSQEGRIDLPTTPTALSPLGLTYQEAALAILHTTRSSTAAAAADSPPKMTYANRPRKHVAVLAWVRGFGSTRAGSYRDRLAV